jgi:hypothetical protein
MPPAAPITIMSETTPAARRLAPVMWSWFNVPSKKPIRRPIHITGCPADRTSQSG